ncbi:MAG: CHAT domain-containing tetratricopeptide repeat protein [Acidobacteriota bacterium]
MPPEGKTVERALSGGESHQYKISLSSGQYLHLVVDQRGIDVVVTLFGPDDRKIIEVDSPNGTQGPEPVLAVAEASGTYRLEVRSGEAAAEAGRYQIKTLRLHAPTEQDRERLAAERVMQEAGLLAAKATPESLRKAINQYEEALAVWRKLGERPFEASALTAIAMAYSTLGEKQKTIEFYSQAIPVLRAAGDRVAESITLNSLGVTYYLLGENQKAIDTFDQGLALSRALGDRAGEATALSFLGLGYQNLGDNRKAIDFHSQALALKRAMGDRSMEATLLSSIGRMYGELGERRKSLEYYNQALPVLRAQGARDVEAATLSNMGMSYNELGEREKAIDFLNQALALTQALGSRAGEAHVLGNIGTVYRQLGDTEKAIDYQNQAIQILRALGDNDKLATAVNNIAIAYQTVGEMQKALDHFNQSLAIVKAIGDQVRIANTLGNLGTLYNALDDKPQALEYFNQALPIVRAVGARPTEAITLSNIGYVYQDQGEYQKALDYFNEALPILRAIEDRDGEATALNNIGWVYKDMGEKQKALDFLSQALELKRTIGDRAGEGAVLFGIGRIYAGLGDKQKALDYFARALPLNRETGDRRGESMTLYGIAEAARDLGNLSEARAQIESAIKIIESLRTKIDSKELRESYFASVQKFYEFYIDLLMRLNQRRPSEGFDAAALRANERGRARSLLELLTEAHADIRQGVDLKLLARERMLQQQLNAKTEQQIRPLGGKHTPEQTEALNKEIVKLTTEYQQVQSEIRATSPRYAALTQPVPLSLGEIQQQVLDPDTLLLEYSLGEERSFLWAVTPTSINSYELPKRSEIEKLARQFYETLTFPNKRNQTAEDTRGPRIAKGADSQNMNETATRMSDMLLSPVTTLLGSKRLLIVADGALQYVPFGALPKPVVSGQLPVVSGERSKGPARKAKSDGQKPGNKNWSLTTDHRPLIVDHEIVSLPSASTLAVLRRELNGRKPAEKTIAVLANPVFSAQDARVSTARTGVQPDERTTKMGDQRGLSVKVQKAAAETGVSDGRVDIPPLPGTRREAERILSFAPEPEGMKATDFAANRETATGKQLSHYRFVHFATHGFLNSEHPELSGIVLSLVNEKGEPQNGFLLANEVYNLNLPAELVVLSACQTGLGKEVKGEGLVGLTRGLMYAGAARVVVSLWSVDDEATSELMTHFYREMLKKGVRPAAALREAQVNMWKQNRWRAPYYWAAFVLQGEWK